MFNYILKTRTVVRSEPIMPIRLSENIWVFLCFLLCDQVWKREIHEHGASMVTTSLKSGVATTCISGALSRSGADQVADASILVRYVEGQYIA